MGANDKREATFYTGEPVEPIAEYIARQPDAEAGSLMPHRIKYFTAADFNELKAELNRARLRLATTRDLLKELQMRADLFTVAEPDSERGQSAIGLQEATTAWLGNLPSSLLAWREIALDGDLPHTDEQPQLDLGETEAANYKPFMEDMARPDWGSGHQPPATEPMQRSQAYQRALLHAERARAAYERGNLNAHRHSGWQVADSERLAREVALSQMWSALL
jgi:hypothetical protein